ncbi:uncharacterized protein LOC127506069 [Ctenopharyngodon idella]|uniref:uncharacterized protein LOC127506069 n=1 Tax=Ctenopharyngodon idella TaxID=7959 RepID=UPI002232584C|nr:uncharacterized protein LOC127506069 [Ctenopharyngodon idella]
MCVHRHVCGSSMILGLWLSWCEAPPWKEMIHKQSDAQKLKDMNHWRRKVHKYRDQKAIGSMLKWTLVLVCVSVCLGQNPINTNPGEETELTSDHHDHITLKQTYAQLMKNSNKLGVFIAAAAGTLTLMAVVYCIYNHFYSKNIYSHTQLHESDIALDLSSSSSSVFSGYVMEGWMQQRMEKGGGSYGSLSDTPSIITLPPPLSPPQRASPFHSLSLSRPPPLRTISAQDLEKSFL